MAAMPVTVIIAVAWRPGDPHREAAWAYLQPHYAKLGWPIYTADSGDQPFSRSKSRNLAVQQATTADPSWDVAVILDADCYLDLDTLRRGVDVASEALAVVLPHDTYIPLSAAKTAKVYAGEWMPRMDALYLPRHAPGGIVILERFMWDTLGGYTWQRPGWGGEDSDLLTRAYALVEPAFTRQMVQRLPGKLVHLYHPQSQPGE
jgi:predicted glycosyltransferase involved in capsule biosynthesis